MQTIEAPATGRSTRSRSRNDDDDRDASRTRRARSRGRGVAFSASTTASSRRCSSRCILLVGPAHRSASSRATRGPLLAIASSIVDRAGPRRACIIGKWPHLASAYITGISVGILIRSPAFWPYVLCSLISITSKYAIRVARPASLEPVEPRRQRDAVPGAGDRSRSLSIQWGNDLWPMLVIWLLGLAHHLAAAAVPHLRDLRRLVPASSRACAARSPAIPWLADVAPITGPMYQLFIFFMITDPKTTVRTKLGPVRRRLPRRARRDDPAAEPGRPRAVLRAVPGRPGGAADRNLAGSRRAATPKPMAAP